MVLRVEPDFDKAKLNALSYDLAQDDGVLRYYNTRLGCLAQPWRAVGVTHEYWEPIGGRGQATRLDSMWISDMADGGSKGDKLERDIRLLTEGLAQEPDNVRYVFYLARSLHDAGRWAEAAARYEQRWKMGGWDEERWYARYQWGLCLIHMGETERAAGVLLEAFEERPTRAEPLHALARHYREKGQNQLAFMLARRGLEIEYPEGDVLFVSKAVYDWQLWEEIMINAYYVGGRHRRLGLAACDRLLRRRGHDSAFYGYIASNQTYYLESAESARRGTFSVSSAVREHDGTLYACANPCVVRWRGETYVNVRLVNYRQERGRVYVSTDPDQLIRTRNVTLVWDPYSGRALAERESSAGIPAHWPQNTAIRGLEDVRWTVHEDRVWFTATCCQVPAANGSSRVVLGRMNEALDAVEHIVPLQYEGAGETEKNWVLWSLRGVLCAIYSYDPLLVLRVDPGSGRTSVLSSSEPAFYAGRFRGSAAPIPVPGTPGRWLAVVHEVAYGNQDNVYTHRFIELDEQFTLTRCSRPFTFDHSGVEYATGLVDLDESHLLVSYGWEDREARWMEFEWKEVLAGLSGAGPCGERTRVAPVSHDSPDYLIDIVTR